MQFGFLGTRVGRRFLAVNLLTALVPVAVITAVSYTFVRAELRNQSETRVSRISKAAGMTALSYLAQMGLTLIDPRDSTAITTNFAVTGLADVATDSVIAPGVRPFSSAQLAHLATGRPLLVVAAAGDTAALHLVRAAAPWSVSARPVRWGRVRTSALFAEVDDVVEGEDAALCIFETTTLRQIHCSAGAPPEARAQAQQHARHSGTAMDETPDGERYMTGRDVYLRHEYGAREWTVVTMRSSAASLSDVAGFRNTFALAMLGVLVLVFALSHAQIRRTTEPLERLEDATRRLSAGDFSTPVEVQGDDEFGHVAQSFNGMASSLHRQISLMRHLDAVDRSAMGARDILPVATEALGTIGDALPCTVVRVAVADTNDPRAMTMLTRERATEHRSQSRIALPASEHAELCAHPRQILLPAESGLRTYRPLADGPALVLPLVKDADLLGVISLDMPRGATITEEACAEARRIADRVALAVSNVQLLTRLDALSTGTVLAFARAIDANSPWTAGHSERVTRIALAIGHEMQLSDGELDTLQRGGLLHDIGKIAVPPAVLDKAGRLTDEEWAVMRRHPVVGCEILSPIPAFADALPIVRSHHERMDGTGYPDRLYGEEIPLLARVMAVADVFDALASDRPYRSGMTTHDACDIIQRGSGTHFDPRVVHAFMDAVHAGRIRAATPDGESAGLAASVARAREGVAQPA